MEYLHLGDCHSKHKVRLQMNSKMLLILLEMCLKCYSTQQFNVGVIGALQCLPTSETCVLRLSP